MQKSQRAPALHSSSSKDTQNIQHSILMLKSRLKFQFQVNSKFTSGDIFSQVAVSLFTLPSCSQLSFLPWIIKPSVRLKDCTIGHTLENTPGWLPGLVSPPASHLHSILNPELPPYFGHFCNLGSISLGPLCLQGFQPSFVKEVAWGSPNSTALSLRAEPCVLA